MSFPKIMKTPTLAALITFILLLIFSCSSTHDQHNFLHCLYQNSHNISSLVYTPNNPSYFPVLNFTIWNLRFTTPSTPKPLAIITPTHESKIPPIIYCAKKHDIQIRTRSGGHDFEALSSVSRVLSFVVIDLIRLSNISVDAKAKTAWVEAGATLGSLYYRINEASPVLAFPGGTCATVGVSGLISGGGYGFLIRKFGMTAEYVVDARIVDVNGRILDRKSMGEDLFWAIRGGGGASFGVIVAWKLQLVDIPAVITNFVVHRTTEQNLTRLLHHWQYVAPRMNTDLTLLINAEVINSTQAASGITIDASFFGNFLGGVDRLLALMQQSFPELGFVREDGTEMSWIQSILLYNEYPLDQPETLLSRVQPNKSYMKRKTDYVERPIPLSAFDEMIKFYYETEARLSTLSFVPYGGRMAEVPECAIPYPHRARNLFRMFHTAYWEGSDNRNSERYINWLDRVYDFMTPYVSKNPRSAYINYRDLDIGVNNPVGKTSYAQASVWGRRYFRNNFDRLVRVKTKVDPTNFFRNEQSIPSLRDQMFNRTLMISVNVFGYE